MGTLMLQRANASVGAPARQLDGWQASSSARRTAR